MGQTVSSVIPGPVSGGHVSRDELSTTIVARMTVRLDLGMDGPG